MQTKRWNDSDNSNRYEWLVLSVLSAQSWVLPQISNLAWDCSAPHKPRSLRYLPVQLFPREKDQLSEDSLFPLAFYHALLRISSVVPSNPVLQIAFSVWQNQAKLGEPDCMLHWSDPPTLLLEVLGRVIFAVHGARKKWNFNLTLNFTMGAGNNAQNWSPTNIQGLNKCITKPTW